MVFDTSRQRLEPISDWGDFKLRGVICDTGKPFKLDAVADGNEVTLAFTPVDATSGTIRFNGNVEGALIVGTGTYKLVSAEPGVRYVFEKNPADWTIVEGGAWGKMAYNLSGPEFKFEFNGRGLEANAEYSLIYYRDPWPGVGSFLIVSGFANRRRSVRRRSTTRRGKPVSLFRPP